MTFPVRRGPLAATMPPRRSAPKNPDPLTLIFQVLTALFVRGGRGGRAAQVVLAGPVLLAVLTFGW